MNLDTISVIGNTPLAAAIAARLAGGAKGPRVLVHGLDQALLATLPKHARIERAPNLFDLASECEAVIAAYDSHSALREALTGTPDRPGLLGAMAPGNILCDFSPGTPDECARLAGQLSGGAIGYVEASLLGDLIDFNSDMAAIYLGGFAAHCDDIGPILDLLAENRRVGSQGHARVLAALVNAKATADAALEDELEAIASAYKLDGQTFSDTLYACMGPPASSANSAVILAKARRISVPILNKVKPR